VTLGQVSLDGSKGPYYLCLATTLQPGATAAGKAWAEWPDGRSTVTEFPIRVIDVPVARQPRKVMAGTAMWPYMIAAWPDFYRQYATLGFNQMNLWHGAIYNTDKVDEGLLQTVRLARKQGIMTSIDASISWNEEMINQDPEAQALFLNGQRAGPCPSYRGPGFSSWIKHNAHIAASGVSYIQSDEELYGGGNYTQACVCPRCEARWRQWLAENRPGLDYRGPGEVLTDRDQLPEHWRAWLWFRASLTTERYRLYKEELARAVAQYGAQSSPKPLIGWWAGAAEDWTLLMCMQDGRSLADTIDQVIPQLYFRYDIPPRRFRELIRRQCWALGGRNCYAGIDSDDRAEERPTAHAYANVPGNLTAAVLETLFAGGQGYCIWLAPYMDTRQWAELAAVNDVIAKHERTLLDGQETDLFRSFTPEGEGDYFHPWSPDICTSTRETRQEGLLLISDYRPERTPIRIERSARSSGPMTLHDAFTGQLVAQLTAGQWDFRLHLKERSVQLLVWRKKEA
jgi:hypothetical protein